MCAEQPSFIDFFQELYLFVLKILRLLRNDRSYTHFGVAILNLPIVAKMKFGSFELLSSEHISVNISIDSIVFQILVGVLK